MENKLFVYGIFLNEDMRQEYGMVNPEYATVSGYVTVGGIIVAAVPAPQGYALTGLLVDIEPYPEGATDWFGQPLSGDRWERLDLLEGGYDRIKITTTEGVEAWMYVDKGVSSGSKEES